MNINKLKKFFADFYEKKLFCCLVLR